VLIEVKHLDPAVTRTHPRQDVADVGPGSRLLTWNQERRRRMMRNGSYNARTPGSGSNRSPGGASPISGAAAIIVALLAFVLAASASTGPHFNPDESRWISRAHYLQALADPFGPTWADRYMTRGQPPLGSYVMGAGLVLQGRDLDTNPPWHFALPWEVNIAIGNKLVAADLIAGRRTSAALVALTAFAVIAIARTFVAMPWALAAGTLFAVHPFTTYIGSLATSDALFGYLIALTALAAASLTRRPTVPRGALVGIVLGLGAATKLSPLVLAVGISVAAALALAVGRLWPRRFPPGIRALAIPGVAIGAAALLTFVAVYPYLWSDPIGRTRQLFAFRATEMAAQASDWPVMAVPSRAEALRRVGINFSERFSLSAAIGDWLGGLTPPVALLQTELLLPLAGMVIMVIMVGMAARAGPHSPRALVTAVLGGQVLVTIAGMRSEFDRYHVPMALLGAVAAAVALDWLAQAAVRAPRWQPLAAISTMRSDAPMSRSGARQGAQLQRDLPPFSLLPMCGEGSEMRCIRQHDLGMRGSVRSDGAE
jgi:hypothetical protein